MSSVTHARCIEPFNYGCIIAYWGFLEANYITQSSAVHKLLDNKGDCANTKKAINFVISIASGRGAHGQCTLL